MISRKKIIIGFTSFFALVSILGIIAFLPEVIEFIVPKEGVNIPSLEIFSRKKVSGCRFEKIAYKIGDIDSGFGVSEDIFKRAIEEAEEVWESATGREIFIIANNSFENSDILTFNLVFDERQKDTLDLKEIFENISGAEEKYEAAKNKYKSLIENISPLKNEIEKLDRNYTLLQEDLFVTVSLYNQKKSEYEEQVSYWNDKGGAPKIEYERLLDEKSDVDILYKQISTKEDQFSSLQDELNTKIEEYNNLAGKVNTIGGILNRLTSNINKDVSAYNRLQADREEFVTGVYKEENSKRSIEVYQFYDYKELVVILAHEMGHALGLQHASSEDSIMYPKITYQEAELSDEDIMLLLDVCKNL